jgi:transposase
LHEDAGLRQLKSTPIHFYPAMLFTKTQQGETTEVLIETFIRKQLRLKAHTVTQVEETDECMIVHIDRFGERLLRCGVCRQRCREVHGVRKEREWRDLSMRKLPLKLRYHPRRVNCPRWLLLKNPWNLTDSQKERLSTLVRWNTSLVRAWYLKEAFQLFWTYKQPWRAKQHLLKWMKAAMRSKLEPFKKFVRMLRSHLDGVLAWTDIRVSNGAVGGMNNKIKSISHRSFGFRSADHFIAASYHCCARLPLPEEH